MNCTGKRCIMQFDKVDPATCKCVSYCLQATPPKTNADLIRSMTDEELADLFDTWIYDCNCNDFPCRIFCQQGCFNCKENWLRWLKQEVEEK